MAPWWWFLREPKHVGATVGILIVLIFLWFHNCVHHCGKIKSALILLMHGANMNQYQGLFFVQYSFLNINTDYEINFVKCFGNSHRTFRSMVFLNILAILYVILYCTTGTCILATLHATREKKPKHVTQLYAYSNVNSRKMIRDGKKTEVGNIRLWSEGEKRTGSLNIVFFKYFIL
jgi:hypothetical protein